VKNVASVGVVETHDVTSCARGSYVLDTFSLLGKAACSGCNIPNTIVTQADACNGVKCASSFCVMAGVRVSTSAPFPSEVAYITSSVQRHRHDPESLPPP
jgi:hypothetical protein